MRTTNSLLVALALLVGACSADTGTTSTPSLLAEVNETRLTSELLYMHDMSPVPLTENDLQAHGIDRMDAIPVRVEVFDEIAVAWFAPDGEAIVSTDNIVALWDVIERGTPVENETYIPHQPETVIIPGEIVVGNHNVEEEFGINVDIGVDVTTAPEVALMDWYNLVGTQDELRALRLMELHHEGC